jgi:hypothetical protein
VLQQRIGTAWVQGVSGHTNRKGVYKLQIRPAVAGVATFRVFAAGTRTARSAGSRSVSVDIADSGTPGDCTPAVSPVDPDAAKPVRCLLARLDGWQAAEEMAAGQMLEADAPDWQQPLTALGGRSVGVVGFDLNNLPAERIDDLVTMAQQDGAVLTASWHEANPWDPGQGYTDLTHLADLAKLLDPANSGAAYYQRFWNDVDAAAAQLNAFGAAGVAVIFRPWHEANEGTFWWASSSPSVFKQFWRAVQHRMYDDGVHNLAWSYAAAAESGAVERAPASADLAGIDTYDCETSEQFCQFTTQPDPSVDQVDLDQYASLAQIYPRMSLSEVGPFFSNGDWDPATVSRAVIAAGIHPVYAMFWIDDGTGLKQIGSLTGGLDWLDTCPDGLCPIG